MSPPSDDLRQRSSVKLYLRSVFRHWRVAVVTVAAGTLGVVQGVLESALERDLQAPLWIWWAIFLTGFVYAQFLAFHDLRIERDDARTRLEAPALSDVLQLHAPQFDLAQADDGLHVGIPVEILNRGARALSLAFRFEGYRHTKRLFRLIPDPSVDLPVHLGAMGPPRKLRLPFFYPEVLADARPHFGSARLCARAWLLPRPTQGRTERPGCPTAEQVSERGGGRPLLPNEDS